MTNSFSSTFRSHRNGYLLAPSKSGWVFSLILLLSFFNISGTLLSEEEGIKVSEVSYAYNEIAAQQSKTLLVNNCAGGQAPGGACVAEKKKVDIKGVLDLGDRYDWGKNPFTAKVKFRVISKFNNRSDIDNGYFELIINENAPRKLYYFSLHEYISGIEQFQIKIISNSIPTALQDKVRLKFSCVVKEEVMPAAITPVTLTPVSGFEQTFQWTSACCKMRNYQLQLLRLYGTQTSANLTDEEWNHSLNIETASPNLSLTISVVEGAGQYAWRVRAIGSKPGGITNPENWGQWSSVSAFNYTQPDNNLNWIYSRIFTEGNKTSEKLVYANGLQQLKQQQTRLQTTGKIIASQTIQDYTGRDAVQSLPIPFETKQRLGFETNLLVKSSNVAFTTADFDTSPRQPEPAQDKQGYYNGGATPNTLNGGVADAEGFPYTRAIFSKDGTGRVKEQSGVGLTHSVKGGKTIKTTYTGVAEEEMISLFGKEAPKAKNVFKVITTDANSTSSVSYIGKDGKTLATALAIGSGNTNLDPLAFSTGATRIINDKLDTGVPISAFGSSSRKPLALTSQTQVFFNYSITPQTVQELCSLSNVCKTCDYSVKIILHDEEDPTQTRTLKEFTIDPANVCTNAALWTAPAFDVTLNAGSYIIEKRVETNTKDANGSAYLDQYMSSISNFYSGKIDQKLAAIQTYLDNKDINGLYTHLAANYTLDVTDNMSSYIVPVDCGVEICIPLLDQTCKEPACNTSLSFVQYFKDHWGNTYPTEITNLQYFDAMTRNMMNEPGNYYPCTLLWSIWQQKVLAYESMLTSAASTPEMANYNLVDDFLQTIDGQLREDGKLLKKEGYFTNAVPTQDQKENQYKLFYYNPSSLIHTNCLNFFLQQQNVTSFEYLPADIKNQVYQCVTSSTNEAIDEPKLEAKRLEIETNCKSVCEERFEEFKQALVDAYHNQGTYIEGDLFTLAMDSVRGVMASIGNDTRTPAATDFSICELESRVHSMVENCQKYCTVSFLRDAQNRIIGAGTPEEIARMKKAMLHGVEINVDQPDNCVNYDRISPQEAPKTQWFFGRNIGTFGGIIPQKDKDGNYYYSFPLAQETSFNNGIKIVNADYKVKSSGPDDHVIVKFSPLGELIWYKHLVIEEATGNGLLSLPSISTENNNQLPQSSFNFSINNSGTIVFNGYTTFKDCRIKLNGVEILSLPKYQTYIVSFKEEGTFNWIKPMNGLSISPNLGNNQEIINIVSSFSKSETYGIDLFWQKRNSNGDEISKGDLIEIQLDYALWFPFNYVVVNGEYYFITGQEQVTGTNSNAIIKVNGEIVKIHPVKPSNNISYKSQNIIVKLDAQGKFVWSKCIYSNSDHGGLAMSMFGTNKSLMLLLRSSRNASAQYFSDHDIIVSRDQTKFLELSHDGNEIWTNEFDIKLYSYGFLESKYSKPFKNNIYYFPIESLNETDLAKLVEFDYSKKSIKKRILNNYVASSLDFFIHDSKNDIFEITGGSFFLKNFGNIPVETWGGNVTYAYIASFKFNDYCPHPAFCFRFKPEPDIVTVPPGMEDYVYNPTPPTCQDLIAEEIRESIETQREHILIEKREAFSTQYTSKCGAPENLSDNLTIRYNQGYHHFTLYYYDRAGNLIRTVPPAGLDKVFFQKPTDQAKLELPAHTLKTIYTYNSLGQLEKQITPDGNTTIFYYDQIGRLRFSQNGKQAAMSPKAYSYTKYDNLSRIIEVGESIEQTDAITNTSNMDNATFPATGYSKTVTVYTTPAGVTYLNRRLDAVEKEKPQSVYLQNRVSYVYSDEDGDAATTGDRSYTYYSYDPHGNVEWLIQHLPGLGKNYLRYEYDLLSNKVLKVRYNEGAPDQFYHKYDYDDDNRITAVYTSRDGELWDKDATYQYYAHGPLKRTEIGEDLVQGLDYTYTLHGWLKGINHPALTPAKDPGNDGTNGAGQDAYGMALGYYKDDYKRVGSAFNSAESTLSGAIPGKDLFNGNISSWTSQIAKNPALAQLKNEELTAQQFTYDELNRIKASNFRTFNTTANTWQETEDFKTSYTYDANGNLLTLDRNAYFDNSANPILQREMDRLTYAYKAGTNQLLHVKDNVPVTNWQEDIDSQPDNNYTYDNIGNLTADQAEGIQEIKWNVYGKISSIIKTKGQFKELSFKYDASGNRIVKKTRDINNVEITTYYVRDASGNTMAVYEETATPKTGGGFDKVLRLMEQPIYGSDRVGMYRPEVAMNATTTPPVDFGDFIFARTNITVPTYLGKSYVYPSENIVDLTGEFEFKSIDGQDFYVYERLEQDLPYNSGRLLGNKQYELKDHLGDVVVTLTDRKLATITLGVAGKFTAELRSYNNYYAFGMQMPGRHYSGTGYRYGYNGKELDKEGMGGGGSTYDYGFRIYNAQIAKFLSVDPLAKSYPWNSTYAFAENSPIENVDLDGLEKQHYNLVWDDKQRQAHLVYSHTEDFTENKWSWSQWKNVTLKNPRQEYVVHGQVEFSMGLDGQLDETTDASWTFSSEEEMCNAEGSRGTSPDGSKYSNKWFYFNCDQHWQIFFAQASFNNLQAEFESGGAKGLWRGPVTKFSNRLVYVDENLSPEFVTLLKKQGFNVERVILSMKDPAIALKAIAKNAIILTNNIKDFRTKAMKDLGVSTIRVTETMNKAANRAEVVQKVMKVNEIYQSKPSILDPGKNVPLSEIK